MTLRIARHTASLEAITAFYSGVLGFESLGGFKGHDGYDGIFLGIPGAAWHLEFTASADTPQRLIDDDDLIVLYPETGRAYEWLIQNLTAAGFVFRLPKNPYWQKNGKLVRDPDGFGIVISPLRISP